MRPTLLDLFCKAGGASKGYMDAGFLVVGVDIEPQPRYIGHAFYQADALEFVARYGREFDAIAASPECKFHTEMMEIRTDCDEMRARHKDFISPLRPILQRLGKPYVMENVQGARHLMREPVMLCGTMFGLRVLRHRLFETNWPLKQPAHAKHAGTVTDGTYVGVYGQGGAMWADKAKTRRRAGSRRTEDWRAAMEIEWMERGELTQAVPPAYTAYIGTELLRECFPNRTTAL